MSFTLGCDPEVFLINKATGKVVSAHDLIPGSKKAPHKVDGGAVQPDGLAAEFNIDPVDYTDFRNFSENIYKVVSQLIPEGYALYGKPSTVFDKDYYEGLPNEAKELGCDPDFCAYSEDIFEPNPRPDGSSGLRSAAGHIHIGWGEDIPTNHPDHINICRDIVREADVYIGLAMTLFDTDCERRKLYGKAGAYRPKSYGVEYRTPSMAWIVSQARQRFIHSQLRNMLDQMKSGRRQSTFLLDPSYIKIYGDYREIINNGDAAKARKILTDVVGTRIPSDDVLEIESTKKK